MSRLLLLLPLLLAGATAQVLAPRLAVEFEGGESSAAAGEAVRLVVRIANGGPIDGTVSLTLLAPEGWSVRAEAANFPLASGAARDVPLTVVAPPAGQGAAVGAVDLTATLTDAAGRIAEAEATQAVRRLDPLVAAAVPAPARWPYAAGAMLLAGSLAGGILLRSRARRDRQRREAAARPLLTVVSGPEPIGLRREEAWRLEVRNPDGVARTVRIEVVARPEGWVVSASAPRLALPPGGRAVVVVFAAPPASTPAGSTARVVLEARSEGVPGEAQLVLNLVAEAVRIPDGRKAAVVLRR